MAGLRPYAAELAKGKAVSHVCETGAACVVGVAENGSGAYQLGNEVSSSRSARNLPAFGVQETSGSRMGKDFARDDAREHSLPVLRTS